MNRPQPPVVEPGEAGRPPSDAIVLFAGDHLDHWTNRKGQPSGWKIVDGCMVVPPKKTPGGGAIQTRQSFGDCQLHIEWCTPVAAAGLSSQKSGNSGVFLMGLYEIQVLNSYESATYPDGQAAAVYGQHPPLVNASREPGSWQVYDILFTAPRFENGSLATPAYVTVFHNGVVVQNHARLMGPTAHKRLPRYKPHPPKAPLMLQDHGDPVRYRNIWIREL
jgi:hypothetical protein